MLFLLTVPINLITHARYTALNPLFLISSKYKNRARMTHGGINSESGHIVNSDSLFSRKKTPYYIYGKFLIGLWLTRCCSGDSDNRFPKYRIWGNEIRQKTEQDRCLSLNRLDVGFQWILQIFSIIRRLMHGATILSKFYNNITM